MSESLEKSQFYSSDIMKEQTGCRPQKSKAILPKATNSAIIRQMLPNSAL
jgi:hypothetical protein